METNLLDRMLNAYQESKTAINIQLQNKVRVSGRIMAFDSYIIVMEGQKREIVYRHAVASITAIQQEEPKRTAVPSRPVAARSVRTPNPKSRPSQPQPSFPASSSESSLNNSMKEGLLKWMQEQKAAK